MELTDMSTTEKELYETFKEKALQAYKNVSATHHMESLNDKMKEVVHAFESNEKKMTVRKLEEMAHIINKLKSSLS